LKKVEVEVEFFFLYRTAMNSSFFFVLLLFFLFSFAPFHAPIYALTCMAL